VFGILFIDYDNFSKLSKKKGQEFTDKLVVSTARFFHSVIRPIDTIARFGYDHFFIQIEDLTNKDILMKIAERIQANLSPYIKAELGIDVTASIGIVYCGASYIWAEDIIKDADIALHFAKQTQSEDTVIFNAVKHGDYRKPEKYASILRVGLSPGDPTKPRT